MILHATAEGWVLREPGEFRDFKVVLDGVDVDDAPPLDGLAFEGTGHAWIRPDLPARLAGPLADEAWRSAFAGMVTYAAKHGWVREDGAVRAHIERAG